MIGLSLVWYKTKIALSMFRSNMNVIPRALVIMSLVVMAANRSSFYSFVQDLNVEIEDAKSADLQSNIYGEIKKYVSAMQSEKKRTNEEKKPYMWDHFLLLKKRRP